MMTDLAVIILTANEKLHIARCLAKLVPLEPRQVFVIDCFSTDGTQEIARSQGATVVEHTWPGNQAVQFNWALDHLTIDAKWILRLDADEYLFPETVTEIREKLDRLPENVTSLSLSLSRTWMGERIIHGVGEVVLTRIFRFGVGRSDERPMDEHIVTTEGSCLKLNGSFIDDNLNDFAWWKTKHLGYAEREARVMVDERLGRVQANRKKAVYLKMPPYVRCVIYWGYRYFIKCGFLDGVIGFRWNFWQGLWYRWLVDRRYCSLMREARVTEKVNK